ncbi:MAG: DUF5615 family PIN-like protein [Chloroflexi bacterium]|nr:DUF5615 family PIN-like protein [Chloroflexota bacterium]
MSGIRLYLDADVSAELAVKLRERKIDTASAREAGRLRASDSEHFAYAVSQQRAILTHNRDDFVELVVEYFEQGKEHFGVIIAPQYEFGELLRRVLTLAVNETAEQLQNQIRYLQAYKF